VTCLRALAGVWTAGTEVDWELLFDPSAARRVDLPTYAFQRERYWLDADGQGEGDPVSPAQWWHEAMFELEWVRDPAARAESLGVGAVLATRSAELRDALVAAGVACQAHANVESLAAVAAASDGEAPVSAALLLDARGLGGTGTHATASTLAPLEAVPAAVRRRTNLVLDALREQLANERLSTYRLAIVTQGALAVDAHEDVSDLAASAVWGLVRSAQCENPGRFMLIDVDGEDASWGALGSALELDEPQVALRVGAVRVPRLRKMRGSDLPALPEGQRARRLDAGKNAMRPSLSLDTRGTALVTGGTGGLGALLARHLVLEHGVRHLVLASRKGAAASGAADLFEELTQLGAKVSLVACDVASRERVERLLADISQRHPLDVVVHAAGAIDDGLIVSLTPERVDRVLGAKVDGAWNLHELTAGIELSAFVMFSSVVGVLGGAGQGSYAAANAFLDALAVHRRAHGLTGASLAWGPWERADGMTGRLGGLDRARMARMGMRALSDDEGLRLLDEAVMLNEPSVVPVRLDMSVLTEQSRAGELSALARRLVAAPAGARGAASAGSLTRLLTSTREDRRAAVVLDLVRSEAAGVLGHLVPEDLDVKRSFRDLGFDSLGGLELRNRLVARAGMSLPVTLIFDYPTPAALAGHLLSEASGEGREDANSLARELDRLQQALGSLSREEAQRTGISDRLRRILSGWESIADGDGAAAADEKIESISDEQMFELIDRELGGVPVSSDAVLTVAREDSA
ncbi:MAG TPA: SDR family NAD(P)-dependent oxidoreductase, partial [Solirubrobacteraceae bacterium]